MTIQRAEYDWICVGSGAAGLSGALTAALEGAHVLVLEKADRFGGGTAYSYGAMWAGANPLQPEAGIDDDLDRTETYLRWLSGGFADEQRLLRLCRGAGPTLAYFAQHGIRFRLIRNLPDHYYPAAPGSVREGRDVEVLPIARSETGLPEENVEQAPYLPPGVSWTDAIAWGGTGRQHSWPAAEVAARAHLYAAGQGLVAWLLRRCRESGVELALGAGLSRLLVEDGRVAGVEAGGSVQLRARAGVLLATGGYEANPRLVRAYEAFPDQPNHFTSAANGDGLIAAAEIGALVSIMPMKLQVMLGYVVPDAEHGFRSAGIQELAVPHTIVVNAKGRRFTDESFFQDTQARLRVFDVYEHRYANLPCYLIFDSQFAAQGSFCGRPPGAPIPAWVARAAAPGELAAQLDIDPAGLEATLRAFNANAARGEDPDFHRGQLSWAQLAGDSSAGANPNLGSVEQAPFYAVELLPSGTAAAGLAADDCARVLHVRGHVIPGLYAAGNVAACTEYGAGFQAGLTLMSGLVFGHYAAQTALAG
ncbi:MAG TPA: FAD-dependent oxidoreductase [Chloroflexota bacterium]|nr:FAD-dependent oxidoreductase [Chloroflexota bacterium]